MKIKKGDAETALYEAAERADAGRADPAWTAKVGELSRLCEEGVSKTHLAFLGTAILAKTVEPTADLFAIKPEHAQGNPLAYSARSLCHGVLVPLAAELGVSIGVTGREPLNNQPYFRMTRLDDGTPVHAGGRAAFDYMVALVRDLQTFTTHEEGLGALAAFVAVRRKFVVNYAAAGDGGRITAEQLTEAARALVIDNSEGGRRAQAVAAGLFDVFAGRERVESGRINDPSRKHPGDVCVATSDGNSWEKAVEVRDKPVSLADVQIFGAKCLSMGVREAAVLMAADGQARIDEAALNAWAAQRGLGISLFYGWPCCKRPSPTSRPSSLPQRAPTLCLQATLGRTARMGHGSAT